MNTPFPFIKMHGLGNDFVVLETDDWAAADWAGLARALCARRWSIGGDGLLVIGPSEGPSEGALEGPDTRTKSEASGPLGRPSHPADFRYRMFNPDGTEDMCGNGLRCVAWRAREVGLVSGDEMTVESLAGPRRASIVNRRPPIVRGEMGRASFRAADLPAAVDGDELWDYPLQLDGHELRLFGASTGTPHVAIFDYGPEDIKEWERLAAQLETHPLFPRRTSVLWLDVISPQQARMRIWERAVGPTLACGTGACAAAAIGLRLGLLDRSATIRMPGGSLQIDIDEAGQILATGRVASVFTGHSVARDLAVHVAQSGLRA